jgi:hypothetical protein
LCLDLLASDEVTGFDPMGGLLRVTPRAEWMVRRGLQCVLLARDAQLHQLVAVLRRD